MKWQKIGTGEQGSLLIDAVIGAALATLVILMPLQMYYSSRGLMRRSTENERAMQVTRLLLDEYRSMLITATPLCEGPKTLYYDQQGLYLGNQTHFLNWTAAQKDPIYYIVDAQIKTNCQDNVSLGASGNTTDIDLKDLKIETSWFLEWNGSYNRRNIASERSVHIESILNGSRETCSALPECHCIASPNKGVNCQ